MTTTDARNASILALSLVLVPGLILLVASRASRELAAWEALLVLFSWAGLKIRGLRWGDVGLTTPDSWIRVFAIGAAGLGIAWVLGAVGEELLYRGFLLDTIHVLLPGRLGSNRLGWWLAVGITSVLFGLAHGFQGRAAVVVAGAIAMGYGTVLRLGGGTLWPVILTHGLYDTVAFILVFKGVRIGG